MTTTRCGLLALALFLAACDSNSVESSDQAGLEIAVANGGNFSDQNGSVSRVAPATGVVFSGPALDGFVQAVEQAGGDLAVLVNTFSGGRIDFVSLGSGERRARSQDLDSPRAAVVVGETLYATLFSGTGEGSVVGLSLSDANLTGEAFSVGSYPEGILELERRLIVANSGFIGSGTTISVIDLSSGTVNTVDVGCDGPRDLVPIPGQDFAVVCHGKTVYNADFSEILEQSNSQVVFLDGSTLTVQDRVLLDAQVGSSGGGQAAAASENEIMVLEGASNAIRRVSLVNREELTKITLSGDGAYVGLSGIAYSSGQWFAGRMARAAGASVPDFTSSGSLVVLDESGLEQANHSVGPAPTHITPIRR